MERVPSRKWEKCVWTIVSRSKSLRLNYGGRLSIPFRNMEPVQTNANDPAVSLQRSKTLFLPSWTQRLKQIAARTLGTGQPSQAVHLPHGEDRNEWLAALTVDFYNETRVLYAALAEACTSQHCPVMSAGPKYEYLWVDAAGEPQRMTAPAYIERLFDWVEEKLEDETLFPVHENWPFAPGFLSSIKVIFKRLFRIYAHVYHCHFLHAVALGLDSHLNTSFKHFLFFVDQYQLVCEEELVPLEKLVQEFRLRCRGDSKRL